MAMRRNGTLVGILITVAVAAPCAWAQRTTAPQAPNNERFGIPTGIARVYQDYMYGVIAKVGKNDFVLTKTKFGIPETIKLDRKTKFIRNGKRSSVSQFKVGDQVYVDVKTNKKTGDMLAKKVVRGLDVTGVP